MTKLGQGAAGDELLDMFLAEWFPAARVIPVFEGADRVVVIEQPYDWFAVDAKTGSSDLTEPQDRLRRDVGDGHYGVFRIPGRRFLLSSQMGQEMIKPWKGRPHIRAVDVIRQLGLRTDKPSLSLTRFRMYSDQL